MLVLVVALLLNNGSFSGVHVSEIQGMLSLEAGQWLGENPPDAEKYNRALFQYANGATLHS